MLKLLSIFPKQIVLLTKVTIIIFFLASCQNRYKKGCEIDLKGYEFLYVTFNLSNDTVYNLNGREIIKNLENHTKSSSFTLKGKGRQSKNIKMINHYKKDTLTIHVYNKEYIRIKYCDYETDAPILPPNLFKKDIK